MQSYKRLIYRILLERVIKYGECYKNKYRNVFIELFI